MRWISVPPPRVWAPTEQAAACAPNTEPHQKGNLVEFVLWIIAVVLVISGIVTLVRGAVGYGILLIVIGLLVGPGGVSVFT